MHGAKVAVHYFAGAKDAAAIVADITAHGGVAVAVGADLRDEDQIAVMFDAAHKQLGNVDILVNNAIGDFTPKPLMELSAPDYLRAFDVSLFGMHACCKRVLPHMRQQRWGKIVNVGSIATDVPVAGQNKYITAKAAVEGYTRSLAVEVAADNIQVNMVVPAMTDTSLLASLPAALVSRLASEAPAGRLLQPIEVAQAIVLLASDWLAGMSGQRLVLNQGAPPFI